MSIRTLTQLLNERLSNYMISTLLHNAKKEFLIEYALYLG